MGKLEIMVTNVNDDKKLSPWICGKLSRIYDGYRLSLLNRD